MKSASTSGVIPWRWLGVARSSSCPKLCDLWLPMENTNANTNSMQSQSLGATATTFPRSNDCPRLSTSSRRPSWKQDWSWLIWWNETFSATKCHILRSMAAINALDEPRRAITSWKHHGTNRWGTRKAGWSQFQTATHFLDERDRHLSMISLDLALSRDCPWTPCTNSFWATCTCFWSPSFWAINAMRAEKSKMTFSWPWTRTTATSAFQGKSSVQHENTTKSGAPTSSRCSSWTADTSWRTS